jgi:anti-sigma B factor antagonist
MSSEKYVRIEKQGDVLLVSPLFTFAAFTDPDIGNEWTAVQEQIAIPEVQHVVVDLGQIPYFGSTLLEWMVQMWKSVKSKGGRFATCNASPIGREVLSAAHFDKLWGVFETRDQALQWLTAGQA